MEERQVAGVTEGVQEPVEAEAELIGVRAEAVVRPDFREEEEVVVVVVAQVAEDTADREEAE